MIDNESKDESLQIQNVDAEPIFNKNLADRILESVCSLTINNSATDTDVDSNPNLAVQIDYHG